MHPVAADQVEPAPGLAKQGVEAVEARFGGTLLRFGRADLGGVSEICSFDGNHAGVSCRRREKARFSCGETEGQGEGGQDRSGRIHLKTSLEESGQSCRVPETREFERIKTVFKHAPVSICREGVPAAMLPAMALTSGKRRLFGCAALSMSLWGCLLVLEIALRLVWQPPSARSDQPFGPHPVLAFAPLPGAEGSIATWEYEHAFRHNRQGLRADREFSRDRPASVRRRALVLGDSFAYGLGSPDKDTFVSLLGEALPGVEVVNGGCNGYGQREELAVLDTLGAALQPDLVVLVFFWNDLENNTRGGHPSFRFDASGRVVRDDLSPEALAAHDPLALREPVVVKRRERPLLYTGALVSEGLKGLRYRLVGIKDRSIGTPEEKARAWEATREQLALIAARCREIGSRLLVVSVPDHNRVDPSARIRGIEPLHFEIEEDLGAACRALGVACGDPTGAMRAARERASGPLYYYADRHLTPEGNRAYAAAILPYVKEALAE